MTWRLSDLRSVFLVLLAASFPVVYGQTNRGTEYHIRFPQAIHHEAQVEARFTGLASDPLEIVMSRSSPGRYALAEFAKNIYGITAEDESGKALRLEHPDTYVWRVPEHGAIVVFRYTVFGDHADGTYDGIDETHAHLNMPATFAWAKQVANDPYRVHFEIPKGSKWHIATQLIPDGKDAYTAANLEMLMDSPVELSQHEWLEWQVESAKFRLALHHAGTRKEAEQYAQYCRAIVLEEEGVFGAFPRYDGGTYTFLADFLPYVYGDGMEHRNSTVISAPADLQTAGKRLAGTASHEFFHSWNVRRIRPRSLEPFDFERANMSGELWFAEGFTQYYGELTLARAGINSTDELAKQLTQLVNTVLNAPGRTMHSAVGMSELAPFVDAAQSVDATNFSNTYISYYTYGGALAFGIDLLLRENYPGRSLDDWMRVMWKRHPDIQQPYTLRDLEAGLAEVTGDPAFAERVFRTHIEGKEPIKFAELVEPAGLLLRQAHPGEPWFGMTTGGRNAPGVSLKKTDDGLAVQGTVREGTPLYEAGLNSGDVITEWGGKRGPELNPDSLLKGRHVGETLELKAKTRGGIRIARLILAADPSVELVTFEAAQRPVTDQVRAFRKLWLSSKAKHPLPELKGKVQDE